MGQAEKLQGLVADYGNSPEPVQKQEKGQDHPTVAQRKDLTAEEVELYEITPEQEEKLNTLRRQKVGRPVGSITGHAKGRGLRATFIISNPDTLRELKYIALADTRLYKEVVNEALTSYVEKWKEKNGEIQLTTNK